MKIQEVLENYNIYKARISIAEEEVQQLKNEWYDIRSAKLDGMPKAKGYTTSNLEEAVVRVQEKIDDKQRYIDGLKTKLKIVDDLVKILKKYNQDIINMRFYQKMSIEQISTEKDRSSDSIKKTINRSIRRMQREYDKNKMSPFCP